VRWNCRGEFDKGLGGKDVVIDVGGSVVELLSTLQIVLLQTTIYIENCSLSKLCTCWQKQLISIWILQTILALLSIYE
jgi:hypothetical protein